MSNRICLTQECVNHTPAPIAVGHDGFNKNRSMPGFFMTSPNDYQFVDRPFPICPVGSRVPPQSKCVSSCVRHQRLCLDRVVLQINSGPPFIQRTLLPPFASSMSFKGRLIVTTFREIFLVAFSTLSGLQLNESTHQAPYLWARFAREAGTLEASWLATIGHKCPTSFR
jgi:hypothetical protein